MSADTITAIGQLWTLVLALALLLSVILFRRQIGGFIGRLRTIKLGDKELQTDKEVNQDVSDKGSEQVQQESVIDVNDGVVEKSKPDDGFRSMVRAFEDSDFELAEKAYDIEKKTAKTDGDRRILQAIYLHFRYTKASDSQAITKLHELSSHKATRAKVLNLLALCYWETKDYAMARNTYIQARDSASEEFGARITASIAECWLKEGNPDRGLREVTSKLREVRESDAKVHLYRSMATMYDAMGSNTMRAIALEKVLEFIPNDQEARFKAAYAQSEAKLSAVSVANYDTLLTLNPKHGYSLNNLGVVCKRSNLIFKSVDYYQKAAGEGNTLAMSNLAFLYIQAGFHNNAAEELLRASHQPNPHENVASAQTQLDKRRQEEQDQWNELIRVGTQHQQFLREFAHAWTETATGDPFSGTWQAPNGEVCSMKRAENEICIEVTHDGARRKLEATSINRTAEGRLLQWKQELWQTEGSFRDGVDALAVVSPDGSTLSILELCESSTALRMKRVSDPA